VNDSTRVFAELNLHTGLTVAEIQEDLLGKQQILEWALSQGGLGTEDIGGIMDLYYKDPHLVVEAAGKNKMLKDVLNND